MKQINKKIQEEKIINTMIENFGNIGESLGLNRTVCQIYALLYFSSNTFTLTEISKALGISKANASINIRKLEEWDALKKVWKKGYTRSLYKANENIEDIIFNRIKLGAEKRLKSIKQATSGFKQSSNSIKIKKLKDFIKKIEFILKNFDSIKSFLR
ncbi:MAG: hypothetical protein M1135_04260 [Candidatus Omnitrophica bacterium]|jgi:DNA-binding transcriptional regulator GbsR (MarR family)|nr:hypothetical protein [Candidatus Omnitrophota bacterium]